MERSTELQGASKLQIMQSRDVPLIKRRPAFARPLKIYNMAGTHRQPDQSSSPTFVDDGDVAQEGNERETLTFSFGRNIMNEIESLLNQEAKKNLGSAKEIVCVQCESFCEGQSEKMMLKLQISGLLLKLSKFLDDLKLLFDTVKIDFKNYSNGVVRMLGDWGKWTEAKLINSQNKFELKIMELEKQVSDLRQGNYFYCERIKILENKCQCLEQKLGETLQAGVQQKTMQEAVGRKLVQLNQQLTSKNTQILNLLEENQSLNIGLKKFMQLASSFNTNISQGMEVSKMSVLKENVNGCQAKNPEIGQVYRQSSFSVNSQFDFKQSLSMCTVNTEDYCATSPVMRNCCKKSSQEKVVFESPVQMKKRDGRQEGGSKSGRKSTISDYSSRKYSWQQTTPEHEAKGRNQILERIKRLKEDIKTEIKDLRLNS